MKSFLKLLLVATAVLVPSFTMLHAEPGEAARVIIVVNSNEPSSLSIGEYYAEARGIPKENIVELSTSTDETISLRQYVDTVYNPLLGKLIDLGWVEGVRSSIPDRYGRLAMSVAVNSVSYVVTVKGVPLRISNDPTLLESNMGKLPEQFQLNNAALDNELALLLAPSRVSMTAFIPSPLFGKKHPLAGDLSRILRVTRLDGPDVASVTRLIDRTLEGEKNGLVGRAYFDIGGPHAKGDVWFNAAADYAQAAYFDTDVETSKKRIGLHSRLDAPAIYMGWYRHTAEGPWAQPRWPVPPGAIAYHLHSFCATSVRSQRKGWLAAFVKQGYCATVGTVYEPYLEYSYRPDYLLEHLLEGHTFGEAASYAYPSLSWMGVAIGDPLYRPFKIDLKEQLARPPEGAFGSYAHIREINRLKSEVDLETALAYARKQFLKQPSMALAYRLSELYLDLDKTVEAAEALEIIRYITVFAEDEQILVKKIADQLSKCGEPELALEIYERLIAQRNLPKSLRIALLRGAATVANTLGDSAQSSRWKLEAQQLATSSSSK
ncbi:MAG: TIGR03790 family protein [Opitutaceae bacterium]